MAYGYFGKVLWIDLTKERYEEETISDKILKQFIGGYGLGCRLVYENSLAKLDPLDPNSILGFFPGLLTSTAAPYSGRYMTVGKSPLTATWGDANSGGSFGPAIKKCGYDGILIKGASDTPKFITIINGIIEINDATPFWGLDIIEVEDKIKKIYGNSVKVAGIGLAGEKLSRISGIVNDKGRIAARSGLGALMGSKKLKMLVLKGDHKVPIHKREVFLNLVKDYYRRSKVKGLSPIKKSILSEAFGMVKTLRRLRIGMFGPPNLMRTLYNTFGTSIANTISAEIGDSPIKNWAGIGMYDFPYEKSKNISSININKYKVKDFGCFSCPVHCGAILKVPELNIEAMHIPEYETCCAFGALLLNDDLLSILEINDLCNRAGIDSISAGATIAFAIECFENGILNPDDTDGLQLKWGDGKVILELVKRIIERKGIGDLLADGTNIASKKIGKNSEDFVNTVIGSEIPMHDPKYIESLAFTYVYDPTPARHTAASLDFSDIAPIDRFETAVKLPKRRKTNASQKLEAQVINTGFHQILSCSGLCMFSPSFGKYPFIDLINALTGWDYNVDDLIKTGIRIQTLRHAFNLREGIKVIENDLPKRISGNPPFEKGPLKGKTVKYKEFYREFCEEIGWNPENAYPLENTLRGLDLEFVIKDLY